jgi:FkbM family methyltransferase
MLINRNDMYVGASLRKYGEFSSGEAEIFRQIVQPGMVVVEVGANIGAHTVELSRFVGSNGLVFAFEPQRLMFQILCANLALNSCTNVHAFSMAVGDRPGQIMVPALPPDRISNFGGLSLVNRDFGDSVPLVTLDSYDLKKLAVLKVDVEGMEANVLRGAAATIRRLRPIIYVENDRQERSAELISTLLEMEYRLYWHLPSMYNTNNFAGDPENIFPGLVSINMLCVPQEMNVVLNGFREVSGPSDNWQS